MREVQRHDGSVAFYDENDDGDMVIIEPIVTAFTPVRGNARCENVQKRGDIARNRSRRRRLPRSDTPMAPAARHRRASALESIGS